MDSIYHDGQRQLQDEFDTRRPRRQAWRKSGQRRVNAKQKAFIESADMFFLATADEHGRPSCTYRGGDPGPSGGGFVKCVDDARSPSPTTTATACTSVGATS